MIDLITPCWDGKEIIVSPIEGTIEEIKTASGAKIYEQQPLLTIRKENGKLEEILAGMDGLIDKLNIQTGDEIVRGEVLVFLEANVDVQYD